MTVVEAQGMDMTDMKAPTGAMPVTVEVVGARGAGVTQFFPSSVTAFAEEDIVARVAGRVTKVLVYPGQVVKPGTLVATIDAPELAANLAQAEATAAARGAAVLSAQSITRQNQSSLLGAQANANAAEASLQRAQTDLATAQLELSRAQNDVVAVRAQRAEASARLSYAVKQLGREKLLYDQGAVSLDELQTMTRDRDVAAAALANMDAMASGANQTVEIARQKVAGLGQSIKIGKAQVQSAKAMVSQVRQSIGQSTSDAQGKAYDRVAAQAAATTAATMNSYQNLTSLVGGVVSERVVSPGTPVQPGQVILRIKSISRVRVQADLPQKYAGLVQPGSGLRLLIDGKTSDAVLTSVFPEVDPATRTFRIEAVVPNKGGQLRPGMFLKVGLVGSAGSGASISTGAIQTDDTGTFVWTILHRQESGSEDWTCTMHPQVSEKHPGLCPICKMELTLREKGGDEVAHRQMVELGAHSGAFTLVKAGLNPGTVVITAGFEDLIEGMPVKAAERTSK